jgi:hypothetical protein
VLIGYMRVSKADGSQVLDLQRDVLIADGVKPSQTEAEAALGRELKRRDRRGYECLAIQTHSGT